MGTPVPEPPPWRAPEHVIDMLLGIMRPYPGPPETQGSISYARAARAEAKVYADRIWAEAVQSGAVWGLARNSNIQVTVSAERFEELKGNSDEVLQRVGVVPADTHRPPPATGPAGAEAPAHLEHTT